MVRVNLPDLPGNDNDHADRATARREYAACRNVLNHALDRRDFQLAQAAVVMLTRIARGLGGEPLPRGLRGGLLVYARES